MRTATKAFMISANRNEGEDGRRTDMRYPYMRDREMPDKASRGTLTWDNTRGAESAYRDGYGGRSYPRYDDSRMSYPRSEMDEPEARRRRDSRGRFRSEMDGYYPGPNYPPPVYERMNQIGFAAHDGSERNNLHMIRGGSEHDATELDEETAREWMENLRNEDGTKGPHWTKEQVKQLMAQKGWQEDLIRAWVAMNAMYSDYCGAAKKVNANNIDFYVAMAKAFLDDKDAGAKDKLSAYYHHIVK